MISHSGRSKAISRTFIQERLSAARLPDQLETRVFDELRGQNSKEASVLIILERSKNEEWQVVLTKRTDKVETHKGQISFPGGAYDPSDLDEIDTALRETLEEIGVSVPRSQILGRLNKRKTISNFDVTTFIAISDEDLNFVINEDEVAKVIKVPLSWLIDPTNHDKYIHPRSGEYVYKFAEYEGEVIWGVTAGIIIDLASLLTM